MKNTMLLEQDSLQMVLKSDSKFRYQMLDRLKSDCLYFLGYGDRNPKWLWGITVEKHIVAMKAIWHSFSSGEKPEWISWRDILDFEKQMKDSEEEDM